jgi:hypothetical protein
LLLADSHPRAAAYQRHREPACRAGATRASANLRPFRVEVWPTRYQLSSVARRFVAAWLSSEYGASLNDRRLWAAPVAEQARGNWTGLEVLPVE